MNTTREPYSWIIEFHDDVSWDEIETWAWDHNVDVDKLPPTHTGDLFGKDFKLIYRAKFTSWDRDTALLGKLRWGGKTEE